MLEPGAADGTCELGLRQISRVVVAHTARHHSAVVLVYAVKLTDVEHDTLEKLAKLRRLVRWCPVRLHSILLVSLRDAGPETNLLLVVTYNRILTDIDPTPRQSKRLSWRIEGSRPPTLRSRRRQL